jgi:hypothetical protein
MYSLFVNVLFLLTLSYTALPIKKTQIKKCVLSLKQRLSYIFNLNNFNLLLYFISL